MLGRQCSESLAGPYSYRGDGSKFFPLPNRCVFFTYLNIDFVAREGRFSATNSMSHFWLRAEQQNDGCHLCEWGETLPLEFLACLYARVLKRPFWAIRHPSCAIFGHTRHTHITHTMLCWNSLGHSSCSHEDTKGHSNKLLGWVSCWSCVELCFWWVAFGWLNCALLSCMNSCELWALLSCMSLTIVQVMLKVTHIWVSEKAKKLARRPV